MPKNSQKYKDFTLFHALFAAFLITSCSSRPAKVNCSQLDWFEQGRRSARSGQVSSFENQKNSCEGSIPQKAQSEYSSGYNSGLTSYCSQENALSLGRMGMTYQKVCPEAQEQSFILSYRKGQKLLSLEKRKAKLAREINAISYRLRAESLDLRQKYNLTTQLEKLKTTKEKILAQMTDIESEAKEKQRF